MQKLLQDIQTIPNLSILTSNSNQQVTGNSNNLVSNAFSQISKATNKIIQPHHSQQSSQTQQQTYSMEEIVRLKTELDEMLANECPWCGERILKSTDEPFINTIDYEAVYNSWL